MTSASHEGRADPFDHADHAGHDHDHRHDHSDDDDDHDHRRGGVFGVLAGLVHPHSHGGPSADRALETTSEGMRAVFVSLGGLAATAAVELIVSILSGSVALLADSIHNFADALTALPLALAFRMGRRRPTRRYTYGFGRAEDVAGVAIVAVMAASTGVAAYEAVRHIVHAPVIHGPAWVAVAGAVGFVGNELVAAYRVRVGRCIGSAALVADGLHARSDGFTSLAVVAGAVAVAAGAPVADPIVALVITGAVAVVLFGAVREVYRRLMDSVDPALVDQVEDVLRTSPGVDDVSDVRIRWVGHDLRAEVTVVSDSSLSLVEAHDIATEAHHRLLHEVPRLAEAVIHTNPSGRDDSGHHDALAHHFPDRPEH